MSSAVGVSAGSRQCQRKSRKNQPFTRRIITRSQCRSSQNFFEGLPSEVFDLILSYLSVVDISILSMASKAISNCVVSHVSTLSWKNRRVLWKFHPSSCAKDDVSAFNHYRSLGLLFKRCTLLLPTKDRLKFMNNRLSQVPCFTLDQCTSTSECLGFACYGTLLQTLIAGWDELECHRVFNFLCEITNLTRKIETTVTSKPGSSPRLEQQIRCFCRSVLLDPRQSRQDSLFWLTCILKPWPMVSQARLLFILYGPLQDDGKLGWQDVCVGAVPQCSLWDLAKAITLLYGKADAKEWTTDTVLGIVDEMAVLPAPWYLENMARLLILCGNNICYSVLASKAINGRLFDISQLFVFIILVSEKDGYCMSWSVKMMQQLCNVFPGASEKWLFLQSMENMLSEVSMEMYELIMSGNRDENQDTSQNLCSLLNACAHFHTEILYMFLKQG
ncbi:F-box only protein 47-like isoform X1 [Engraulis encrasicolus]|uniref:F-box only protein 47-like isoform X1 n=1 Tax=Engraulis encrasicolus TaxID=184585 RepID=UPI002FD65C3E